MITTAWGIILFLFFFNCIVPLDSSHGKSGSISSGKVICDGVALLNLRCMLRVLVFHNPPNSDTDYRIMDSDMDYRIFKFCTYVNASDCTRKCTDNVRESALKVDSGEKKKSLAAPINRTCVSGVTVQGCTNRATFPPAELCALPNRIRSTGKGGGGREEVRKKNVVLYISFFFLFFLFFFSFFFLFLFSLPSTSLWGVYSNGMRPSIVTMYTFLSLIHTSLHNTFICLP